MSDTVIRVENLGKRYIIGHQQQEKYTALRDVLADKAKGLTRLLNPNAKVDHPNLEEFWALKDVSFEVKRGDRVGIIGRNGAGKSTLLKILSRITEPTTGRVQIKGRVASLLEVGTGFHPELTGRENIFLNGAILGMEKQEIRRKFDEIVAFAEVERFLDTPVKRYSSGMYVRLAFAVAAHLEPEILVVDEVLAVGDTAFQKKCLGKMEDVADKEGRTILFVSHNISAIEKLCNYGIYLKNGNIEYTGDNHGAILEYLEEIKGKITTVDLKGRKDRQGSGKARIVNFRIVDTLGNKQSILKSGEDYVIQLEYEKNYDYSLENVVASIGITDENQNIVYLVRSNFTDESLTLARDFGMIECHIKDFNLTTGRYACILFLSYRDNEVLDLIRDAVEVNVQGGDFFGTGSIGLPSHCKVLTRANWRVK